MLMNVVDSSGWIEYFVNGKNANFFNSPIRDTGNLLVPTICLYEVFKRVHQQRGEGDALQAVAAMQQGTVIDLDARIALGAARISLENKLPMAGSIILATAQAYGATVWTQDDHFKGLSGVQYRKRRP